MTRRKDLVSVLRIPDVSGIVFVACTVPYMQPVNVHKASFSEGCCFRAQFFYITSVYACRSYHDLEDEHEYFIIGENTFYFVSLKSIARVGQNKKSIAYYYSKIRSIYRQLRYFRINFLS